MATVALIAGKGMYPIITASRLRKANIAVKLIAFEGETRDSLVASFEKNEKMTIKVGQVGKLLKALQRFDARYAIMAGQITPKRLFKGLHPDLKALALLAKLKERNAETIFGALASEMEKVGTVLIDARAFLDDQLATEDSMTQATLSLDSEHLEHGINVAREVARLDIGQGIVVNKGTVLAVEAFEGTDAMLQRAGSFEAKHALFIKTVKPNQDYRFDVPVFGMKTLEVMKASDIHAAALEADNVIMIEKDRVLEQADEWKIPILGFKA